MNEFSLLSDLGYTGHLLDRVYKYLGDQGFSGSLQDRMYQFLAREGYTGSLNDMFRQKAVAEGYSSVNEMILQGPGIVPFIRSLFTDALGIHYDFHPDFLYQDSAGTTPGEVNQPVGLVLDRSQGLRLGSELWVSPTLGTYWTDNGDGSYTLNDPSSTYDELRISDPTPGRAYQIDFDYQVISGGLSFRLDDVVQGSVLTGSGSITLRVRADASTNTKIAFVRGTTVEANEFTVSNISVRELPGHHATQSTATARPILRQDAEGRYYSDDDLTDDALVVTLPDMGTDATVAYVTASGVTILENQTISGSYTLPHADMYSIVVLERPFTAAEEPKVTAYLNRRAGL